MNPIRKAYCRIFRQCFYIVIPFRSLWAKKNLQLCMRLSEDNEIGYRRISKKTERFF